MRCLRDHEINNFNRDHVMILVHEEPGEDIRKEYSITFGGTETIIKFQYGPISEVGVNGITNEALLAIVIDRLRGFQTSRFSCRENALALTKLEEAMMWLHKRTLDRERRGVEGTHQK